MNVRLVLQYDGRLARERSWRLNDARTGIDVRLGLRAEHVSIALRWRVLMRRGAFVAPSDAGYSTWIVQAVAVPDRIAKVELQLEGASELVADVMQRW